MLTVSFVVISVNLPKTFLLDGVVFGRRDLHRKEAEFGFVLFFFVNVGAFLFFVFFFNNKNIECSAQNPPTNQRWPFPTVLNFTVFLQMH